MDSFDCHGQRTHWTETGAQPRTQKKNEREEESAASMPHTLLPHVVAWLVRGFFSTCRENPLTLLHLGPFSSFVALWIFVVIAAATNLLVCKAAKSPHHKKPIALAAPLCQGLDFAKYGTSKLAIATRRGASGSNTARA